jgi:hypothetical protein
MAPHTKFTIQLNDQETAHLKTSWEWLLGSEWQPILCSAIGDIFFVLRAKSVWWLSTATGELEQVATNEVEFSQLLNTERVDEWFLPGLVEALIEHGQRLKPSECYSYRVFPVFEHGSFSVENMFCMNIIEHFDLASQIHHQVRAKPDGSSVRILVS